MTELEKAIKEIESFIHCENGVSGPLSQTDEPYKELIYSVPVFRYREHDDPFTPMFVGCCALVEAIRKEAHEAASAAGLPDFSGLTLYWRVRPECEITDNYIFTDQSMELDQPKPAYFSHPLVGFYARLLITAKQPAIEAQAA